MVEMKQISAYALEILKVLYEIVILDSLDVCGVIIIWTKFQFFFFLLLNKDWILKKYA